MGPVLLLCVAAALASISFFLLAGKRRGPENLPPGELGTPWLGETLDFYRAQRRNRLHEDFLEPRFRKHGRVFKTRLMGDPTVVVGGAAANRFFLSNEFKLVVSAWPAAAVQLMGDDCIMQMGGARHKWTRGAVAACLSGPALEAMVPLLCRLVRAHLERHWRGQEEVKLFPSVKRLMFSVILECLFGIRADKRLLILFKRVESGVFAAPVDLPGFVFWKAKRARREVGRLLVAAVRERRRRMEESQVEEDEGGVLMSRFIKGMIDGEITEQEVVDNVVLLVFAAHDTTTYAIAMMCRFLGSYQDCYSRLLEEHLEISRSKNEGEELTWEEIQKMKYTWQVSRESMRLFPPIFGSFRKAMVDIHYQGFTIPKGWKVLWTTYGTHYDPQYFPEPTRFDPSRFEEALAPYVFIPFGGGPRLCAGYQLAKLKILIFIHFMVTNYDWSLDDPSEPIVVDPLPFPLKGMPIKITQRKKLWNDIKACD